VTTAGSAGTVVLPRYGDASLTDVLPSVLGALGVAGEQNDLDLPTARQYCVLLIDALGWNAMRAHQAQASFLNSMPGSAITASVPSTTVTSLTSLGTGLAPGRHGLLGYTTRKPGTATTLFNALRWDEHKDVDPLVYQPHPTASSTSQVSLPRRFGAPVLPLRTAWVSGLRWLPPRPPPAPGRRWCTSTTVIWTSPATSEVVGRRRGGTS
jgi:hypothetical protein